MLLPVFNKKGKKGDKRIEVSDALVEAPENRHVVYLDVKRIRAQRRQGTHQTKERSQVRGSTAKIQNQKGSGNARKGDIKSPIFRGGGRIFGPKPRSYAMKINKKTQRLARRVSMAYMLRKERVMVIENIKFEAPKTKNVVALLKELKLEGVKTTFVLSHPDRNFWFSMRNIPNVFLMTPDSMNTYDILNSEKIVVMEDAIPMIQEKLL